MSVIHCIVGLPGSGKTHYGIQLLKNKENCLFLDDIDDRSEIPDSGIYDEVVITDPNFCLPLIRNLANEILKYKGYTHINWIFFENDKEKALNNVVYRNDGRKVENLINLLHTKYSIPNDYKPLVIWQSTT
jgi:hypothetical protein